MIEVTCSHCGLRVLVPPTVQGRQGACFGCGAKLTVPTAAKSTPELSLDFAPGTRISDRYLIESWIGKGGMGVVYRAEDTLMSERVALKFMYPKFLRTQRGQAFFIQEAQIARRLRHDNIVAVHDVTSTPEGIMYISMELLKGQSLRAFLRKRREERRLVGVRLTITVLDQVLNALDYAHRAVVHRDMKPENIMLLPGERVKVLDFGLAKAIDEEVEAAARPGQTPKQVIGTKAYAAPEQVRHEELDGRADVYAAGLILREMLTLRTPKDKQIDLAKARGDVAPSLIKVIDKAIREQRGNRWQTAGEFRQALLEAFDASYRRERAAEIQIEPGRKVSTEGMVYLEGGSFLMGNNTMPEEAPEFEAHVDSFYMDKYPVTTAQYAEFLEETGHPPPKFWDETDLSGPDQPVVGVTWADANDYAAWAGKRLPTEPEWEYAARGKDNRRYPWGNQELDSMRCNYGDYLNTPSIVTMHEEGATPDGICDLAGNVFEWTVDRFVPYRDLASGRAATSAEPRRVVRGGSWHSPPEEVRCTARKGVFPETQLTTIGFRCILPARNART